MRMESPTCRACRSPIGISPTREPSWPIPLRQFRGPCPYQHGRTQPCRRRSGRLSAFLHEAATMHFIVFLRMLIASVSKAIERSLARFDFGNTIDTQFVTVPDVQPTAKHNRMRPCRTFARILDLQLAGELKSCIRRFHQGHVAVVRVEIEHAVGIRETSVLDGPYHFAAIRLEAYEIANSGFVVEQPVVGDRRGRASAGIALVPRLAVRSGPDLLSLHVERGNDTIVVDRTGRVDPVADDGNRRVPLTNPGRFPKA